MSLDPSGTTPLAKRLAREIRKRLLEVARGARTLLVDDDALGLEPSPAVAVDSRALVGNARQAWRFLASAQKAESFQTWLRAYSGTKVLDADVRGDPWLTKFVREAHAHGVGAAYVDASGARLRGGVPAYFAGHRAEFLRSALKDQVILDQVRLLSTRAFEELRGVTDYMSTQLGRILANGLVRGATAKQIAREITEKVEGISRERAERLARTELVHAAAEGQLAAYARLGVEKVGLYAEWTTAQDDRVCRACAALEGQLFTLREAHGMIPRHVSCRCAWTVRPRVKGERRGRRSALSGAAGASVRAETGRKTRRGAVARSTWAGRGLAEEKK